MHVNSDDASRSVIQDIDDKKIKKSNSEAKCNTNGLWKFDSSNNFDLFNLKYIKKI